MVVHTTLEPKVQEAARLAGARNINKFGKKSRAHEAAVVFMRPDGAVSALIGGVDYQGLGVQPRHPGPSPARFGLQALRLSGGAGNPACRPGRRAMTRRWKSAATPRPIFGGKSYGTLTLADALAHSVKHHHRQPRPGNRRAAKWWKPPSGWASPPNWKPMPALALGTSEVTPLELTAAYCAFANGGYRVTPYMVTQVDIAGHAVYQRRSPQLQRVIDAKVDRDMVAHAVRRGDQWHRRLCLAARPRGPPARPARTQDSHDRLVCRLHQPDYVAAAWIGNDDSSPTRGVTGGTLPAYIWRDAMLAARTGPAREAAGQVGTAARRTNWKRWPRAPARTAGWTTKPCPIPPTCRTTNSSRRPARSASTAAGCWAAGVRQRRRPAGRAAALAAFAQQTAPSDDISGG